MSLKRELLVKSIRNRRLRSVHSLANIADAWKGYTVGGRRGSTLSSIRMSAGNALDCAARHESLECIQIAVIQMFQKKKLQEGELYTLQEHVRELVKTEAGPLIYDYFKDKLLKKGMVILREYMKNDLGSILLNKISDQWNYFYTEILPTIQAMLYQLPVKVGDKSVRQVTLLSFRDIVVLKVGTEETMSSLPDDDITPDVRQMLLVLQSVHDGYPPSENHLRIEKLVARCVSPYLGFFGLYEGSPVPTTEVSIRPTTNPKLLEKSEAYEFEAKQQSRPRSMQLISPRSSHRPGNGFVLNHLLAPVVEQETGRRHSIDVYDKLNK
ncbi:proline-rich protein 5-like isoform X1 [Mytilus californianus]|uniref:proline-rich protein 5-like isoform X1 n=2 Tax=Mytilus californianus TaxID=6549 RepID=UPI0022471CFD|nr:proline-rich protein 5-like isoform X1 [Mytilus californianus]